MIPSVHRDCVRVAACLALLALASPAKAQGTWGQILGHVLDPTGAAVQGATVRAVNVGTAVETKATTGSSGDFILSYLIPGVYNVTVEAAGFDTYSREHIELEVNSRIAVDAALKVGSAQETIRVTEQAAILNTADASEGGVIDSRKAAELPLKDGNPFVLENLTTGVMNLTNNQTTRVFDAGGTATITVNGTDQGNSEFSIDGMPDTVGTNMEAAFIPPPGAVQEFKIQTLNFDATNGFVPGAVINLSLKSGTNKLHGEANSFIQNPDLAANTFFSDSANLPKVAYRQNRWEGMLAGPVIVPKVYDGRNRTFWMYDYSGVHDSLPNVTSSIVTVPTAAERNGDFSALLALGSQYQIYDPATITPAANGRTSRQPFPGNIIPQSRFSPVANAIVSQYYPLPDLTGSAAGVNNRYEPTAENNTYWSQAFRVDEELSEHNRIFISGDATYRNANTQYQFNGALGRHVIQENRGIALDDVYVFNPRLVLNLRYSFSHYLQQVEPDEHDANLAALGFSSQFINQINSEDPRGVQLPYLQFSGYANLGSDVRSALSPNIHSFGADMTWVKGSHTVQFGVTDRIYLEAGYSMTNSSGNLVFGSTWTNGPLDNSAAAPIGQDLASFLLGLPSSGSAQVSASYAEKYQVGASYIQDLWRVSRRLTLTPGLRYERTFPTTERYNRGVGTFEFTAPSPIAAQVKANYAANPVPQIPAANFNVEGGLTFLGNAGAPRAMWNPGNLDFAPRLGAAFQIDDKTVIRGGVGLFYESVDRGVAQMIQNGFSSTTTLVPTLNNGVSFVANLANPFPNGFNPPTGNSLGLMTSAGQAVTFTNSNWVDPRNLIWQVDIQRRFGHQTLLEVSYVGNKGYDLGASRNYNAIPDKYLSTLPVRDQATINMLTAAVPNPFYPLLPSTSISGTTVPLSQLLLPNPEFTTITGLTNLGSSIYQALQTRFEKRLSSGYILTAGWTWSKFLEATSFLNGGDPEPAKAISTYDRTHRVVVTGLWELPFGAGKPGGSSVHGWAGKTISGWALQGIYQAQSGAPLGFGDAIINGNIGNVVLPSDQRTVQEWFNKSAFVTASGSQLADNLITLSPRFGAVRAAGLNQFDLSASKNTYFTEHAYAQFRCEFLNAFNHPEFGAPNTTVTSTAFGTITTLSQPPRTIEFGLRLVF